MIERRRRNSTLVEGSEQHHPSIASASEAEDARNRSTSFSSKRTKVLYMFEIVHKDAKNMPLRVYSGEENVEYSCTGWVFGCNSQKDAEEWVR